MDTYIRTYIVQTYVHTKMHTYMHTQLIPQRRVLREKLIRRYTTSEESPSAQLSEPGSSLSCSKLPPLGTILSQLNPVIISSSPSRSNVSCSYPKSPLVFCLFYQNFVFINILIKHTHTHTYIYIYIYIYIVFLVRILCTVYLIHIYFNTHIICDERDKFWCFPLCSVVTSLSSVQSVRTPISNTRNLSSCLRARD